MSKKVITKTKKAPMEGKVRKGFKAYVGIILCLTMLLVCGVTAFAADDPVAVVNNLSTFIFGLIENIADLNFEYIFEMFEYRADSELQKTPKQVIINLVTRVVNIIFPGAFKASTTIDALVTNQALAGTVRAIFDDLWLYKANIAKVALPLVCSLLDLTNAQEFEFPELTWDPTDANVEGNSIRTAGSVAVKLMVRNGSTGINTGYTDKNGVFHQDKLYTYDIKSVTTHDPAITVSYPNTIAGGQTAVMTFQGAVKASSAFVVTMTYDVLTEDGSPLTEEPITETMYSYIAYNEQPDDTTKLTSTTVGGFSITDGTRYLYANSFGDLEDYEITIQNTNATAATAVPYFAQSVNTTNNKAFAELNGVKCLQLRTDETAIIQQVEDAAGIANIKLFETTEAYDNLTGEERETLWDDMIANGIVYNPRTGAIQFYPKMTLTVGAKINGTTTVQNTGALVFIYKDFGLPGMLESEMGKHRQASAYATAASTVFEGKTVWEAYGLAMEAAAKAVYSCFRNTTFNTPAGKFSFYEPAYNNLVAAIEELDAQVLSAGVASSQELIDKCYPDNPEDLAYYDPAYIHHGVSDYVPYTYYNFRDELRALEDMIYWATTPDEETGEVAVVNELDKAYREHKFSLYFGRLLEVEAVKTHLENEINNPTREIGAESEYDADAWYNYSVALNFAIETVNDPDANPTQVKTAYRYLLEEQKRLVPAGQGGGDIGGGDDDVVTFEPVNPNGGATLPEIFETESGVKILTGVKPESDFAKYFACSGCYAEVTENEYGIYSTGAIVDIISEATGEVIESFVVAVFADLTGDGATDTSEVSVVLEVTAGSIVADELQTIVGDTNGDEVIDTAEITSYLEVAAGSVVVNYETRVIA